MLSFNIKVRAPGQQTEEGFWQKNWYLPRKIVVNIIFDEF